MIRIVRVAGKKNGCNHRDLIGVGEIEGVEVGLCVDCRKIVNNSKGFQMSKEIAFKWMSLYSMEITNFKLWEVY